MSRSRSASTSVLPVRGALAAVGGCILCGSCWVWLLTANEETAEMFDRPAKGSDGRRFPRIARIGRVSVDEGGGLLLVGRVEGHAAPREAAKSREVAGDDGTIALPRPFV